MTNPERTLFNIFHPKEEDRYQSFFKIASFVLPRAINFSQMASGMLGILTIVFGASFSAIVIRCFLQWSANIWRNTNRKIPQKLLNFWIYSEELLVIATTSAILALIVPKEHSHVVTILSILGLGILYRKIKQLFSLAINNPTHILDNNHDRVNEGGSTTE